MEMLRFQSNNFQLKKSTPVFQKKNFFSEDLFKILNIENVQNLEWLSDKNMSMKDYFIIPCTIF